MTQKPTVAITVRSLTWLSALVGVGILSIGVGAQGPAVRITSPLPDTVVSGEVRLDAVVTPSDVLPSVQDVTFTVNGKVVCTVERPPFGCWWKPGEVFRAYRVRVVARLADGRRLIDNLATKDIGYAEQVRANAVLVPVIVTEHGQFVRGLTQKDFEVFEDNVPQPIASMVSEDAPLELALAIDVSGSMEDALVDVKAAVKQLLSKLRPGDAATLVGFNDTTFIVAEREKDQRTREEAVDLLTSWGGTALYDATVRTLDLISRDWGRKGVVIFSDGDDRQSLTPRETAMARVQASDAMLYTVGFGGGAVVPGLRSSLESYARATGGRPFFPRRTKDLDGVFDEIVAELSNQYVLSYSSTNRTAGGAFRHIKVKVKKGKYDLRYRKGYLPDGSQRSALGGPGVTSGVQQMR